LEYPHRPVLVDEVVRNLVIKPQGVYVDGTAGTGGHSEVIAQRLSTEGRLICLDRDPEAVRISKQRMSPLADRVTFIRTNYIHLDRALKDIGMGRVDGILLDLGMSTLQLDHGGRGFSFSRDEPLDMRMDPDEGPPASQLVNTLSTDALEKILREYGEERRAKSIARRIQREREQRPIESTGRLAELVASVVPKTRGPGAKHPATRTFQALRIAVNGELENLRLFLDKAPSLIEKEGRLVILSYHSLEDRIVKQAIRGWEKGCQCPPDLPLCGCGLKPLFKRINKKGIRAGRSEIQENPRARSATMRAAERI